MAQAPFSITQYALGRPASSAKMSSPRAFVRSLPEAAFAQNLDQSISIQKIDTIKSMVMLEQQNKQLNFFEQAMRAEGEKASQADDLMTGEMQLLNSRGLAAVSSHLDQRHIRPLSAQDVTTAYRGKINKAPISSEPTVATTEAGKTPAAAAAESKAPTPAAAAEAGNNSIMGTLSSKYESGSEGVSAVGYDPRGGTSYGKYQFSSKAGIVDAFIKHLEKEVPQFAERLKNAGPSNTGGRKGQMPEVWREIAEENAPLFERLQDDFTRMVHLEPAINRVKNMAGIDVTKRSEVLQEVLLSTAVQHGPGRAGEIFSNAAKKSGPDATDAELIENIYADRKRRFGSSSPSVRRAVMNRLDNEMAEAIQLLNNHSIKLA